MTDATNNATLNLIPRADEVGLSAEELARRNADLELKANFCYLFEVRMEHIEVSKKKGTIMHQMMLAPCDSKFKAQRPMIRHNMCYPWANPRVEGHQAPDTMSLCNEFLAAIDEQFPGLPRKVKDSKPAVFKTADGREINAQENLVERLKCETLTEKKLKEIYAQILTKGRALKGEHLYGVVFSEEGKDEYAGTFSKVVKMLSPVPVAGYTLLTDPAEFGEPRSR